MKMEKVYKTELDEFERQNKEDNWDYNFFCISDYNPMLNAIGNIIIAVDDENCQGDSRILYQKNNKIGYLIFGWGSCPGCDALRACKNIQDVEELYQSLKKQVKWFNSKQEALDWFTNKDWELEHEYHAKEFETFINKVIKYLKE